MNATSFELRLTVPAGPRFHPAIHSLVVKAGTYAGCAPSASMALADAVVAVIAGLGAETPTEVKCWRQGGPIGVAVVADVSDGPMPAVGAGSLVRVRCMRNAGRRTCTLEMDV